MIINIMFYVVCGIMIIRVLYKEGKEDLREFVQRIKTARATVSRKSMKMPTELSGTQGIPKYEAKEQTTINPL
jgi:hypothetical protein